ncbi:MAG: AAA family ATPase [Pseudoclavibacter caeni]
MTDSTAATEGVETVAGEAPTGASAIETDPAVGVETDASSRHPSAAASAGGITLTGEQQAVLEAAERGQSVFVTGRAGTGKSTLLARLVREMPDKVVVCAPTGVAALNVGGQTIHSLFGLRVGVQDVTRISRTMSRETREVLAAVDTVIVDEVSMVSADLLDAMDRSLRVAKRRSRAPFGGAQLIMFGDPYQLAPVPPRTPDERAFYTHRYQSQWFFDAQVWQEAQVSVYELTNIHRQRHDGFKQLLDAVREGRVPDHWIARLNQIGHRQPPADEPIITLATTNRTVDRRNAEELARLPGRSSVARADIEGEFGSAFPADPELELKPDAQVMFLRNDPDGRWVNGSIGTVVAIRPDKVIVELDGSDVEVEPVVWERYAYTFDDETQTIEQEQVGEFTQFPLRLAWAVTIHKSQGQTYDRAVIDLGARAFSPGQVYVALSRLTSLDGLYLTRPVRQRDIIVDARVQEFMRTASSPMF